MATIKAIKASSVHQIQSGQVIVDIGSVVKELVENSLDAGATSIEVRFKNNGLDSIEVQDNGKGIAPEDYESVALKHHTSKLADYDDLDSLQTFGFRGEALSSLCALSDFHVVTAVAGSGAKGSKLDFDVSGKLINTSVVAAPKGTTVAVEKLFKNLPVRRKELEKNIKREYQKVLTLLQSYACISTNVKFGVYNTPAKGKRTLAFATNSNASTRDNIANVHGAKTLSALVDLDLVFELKPTTTQAAKRLLTGTTDDISREVRIKGHISKPVFGEGRQAPDKQTFFVNSRPCMLPQVAKAINEVYKGFNVSQMPFIFANLVMDTNSYDVNVSPDKRTILLHDQTELLDSLKASLTAMFDAHDHTVPTSQLGAKKLPAFKQPSLLHAGSSWNSQQDDQSADLSQDQMSTGPRVSDPAFIALGPSILSKNETTKERALAPHPVDEVGYAIDTSQARDNGDEQSQMDTTPTPERTVSPEHPANPRSPSPRHASIASSQPSADSPPPQAPRQVQDFNARLFSQQLRKIARPDRFTTETVRLNDGEDEDSANGGEGNTQSSQGDREEPIAVSRTPKKITATGPVQNAFDRMRPKRTADEVAEVTAGGQTMIMKLSGPDSKRRRIHTPLMNGEQRNLHTSGFVSTLRSYAAPGTQFEEAEPAEEREVGTSEDEMEVDEGDDASEAGCSHHGCSHHSFDHGADHDHADDTVSQSEVGDEGLSVEADGSDDEYLDDADKKAREDARVAALIRAAEETAARPTSETMKRASAAFRSTTHRKDSTLSLVQTLSLEPTDLLSPPAPHHQSSSPSSPIHSGADLDTTSAEAKLTLTISKSDFSRMRIVGQFNLGFILAVRPGEEDHLFIIDQHAADEKSNFERLSASTRLEPQRLVTPKELHLTAVEAELVAMHEDHLLANGFQVSSSSTAEDGQVKYALLTLPTSRETTFSPADLEELLHLLSEGPTGLGIVRPSRVRRMLAMRACRSSIMVGRALSGAQMDKVVRGMGGLEKPWNCPHGRPTMRHLAGLSGFRGWEEERVDWQGWMGQR